VTFEVTQGHRKWHNSTGHTSLLSVVVYSKKSRYLAPFPRYYCFHSASNPASSLKNSFNLKKKQLKLEVIYTFSDFKTHNAPQLIHLKTTAKIMTTQWQFIHNDVGESLAENNH